MNPYDFAPIDFSNLPERHEPILHGKFAGVSGCLTGSITAETPIFIPLRSTDNPKTFIKNKKGVHIIPGTSLKGLFRSLVETVANGCFGGKFDGKYSDNVRGKVDRSNALPKEFKGCTDLKHLCIACRIFGTLEGGNILTGKVSFQDATCDHPVEHKPIYTVDLMGPKPHHEAFYMDGNIIAGRKFYFHHPQGLTTKGSKTPYNQHIKPLDKGTFFTFTASFNNLEESEWQALLYAIVLEPEMRHKLGYAKPSGLGSVKMEIISVRAIDYKARYTQSNKGTTEYSGEVLERYIEEQVKSYKNDRTSPTLNSLRRIWGWDPNNKTSYKYPDFEWFKNNPKTSISKTP